MARKLRIRHGLLSYFNHEPKAGKWKIEIAGNGWNEWYVYKCPLCGASIQDNMGYHEWNFNYCPNCGAKMK